MRIQKGYIKKTPLEYADENLTLISNSDKMFILTQQFRKVWNLL
jgi:hypothetical protein